MSRDEAKSPPPSLRRALLLVPVVVAIAAFFALGLNKYVTLHALAQNREWLIREVEQYRVLAPVAFVVLYTALVGVSIPGATFLTIVGGFLFGTVLGAACTVTGATAGAVVIFLLARTAVGEALRARAGPFIQRLEHGFQKNALNYLLFLRLVPVFPFWAVNLVPAFLGVRLRDFVIGTALGILPGTIVYSSVGGGLGAIFESGGRADLHSVGANPRVYLPMIGLALLSLIPIAIKRWSGRKSRRGQARAGGE